MIFSDIHQLSVFLGSMRSLSEEAHLIGSQTRFLDPDRDIDLVFVPLDGMNLAAKIEMLRLQRASCQLFHPTFVSGEQLSANPAFRDLLRGSVRLW